MPDPMGGKRLLDYDCKITYQKSHLIKPRKIRKPDDVRPGTKKGKLDRHPIWIVSIMMPKKLLADIYGSYKEKWDWITDPATEATTAGPAQPADDMAAGPMEDMGAAPPPPMPEAGGEMAPPPEAGAVQ